VGADVDVGRRSGCRSGCRGVKWVQTWMWAEEVGAGVCARGSSGCKDSARVGAKTSRSCRVQAGAELGVRGANGCKGVEGEGGPGGEKGREGKVPRVEMEEGSGLQAAGAELPASPCPRQGRGAAA